MAPAGLIAAWEAVRTHTLAMAAAMPAERYDSRPVPEAMSFAEQLRHLVGVERALRQGLATGRRSGPEGAPPGPDDRASLLDLLAREGEETRAFLRALPPAEWARPRPLPAGPPASAALPTGRWRGLSGSSPDVPAGSAAATVGLVPAPPLQQALHVI